MPKFKSLEGQQQFQQSMDEVKAQRRDIWADLIWKHIPKAKAEAMPKKSVAQLVINYVEGRNGELESEYPFLLGRSKFFFSLNAFSNYWPDVKDILAETGKFIAYNSQGVYGTHSKTAIEQAFAAQQRVIESSAERYNYRAELANHKKKTMIPTVAIQLALPAPQ